MKGSQEAPLIENVSDQNTGICLLFQPYVGESPQKYGYFTYFFPKYLLSYVGEGYGYSINITNVDYGFLATKYLYFYNNKIKGNDVNIDTKTIFGESIDNKRAVLTAVFGV